MSNLPFRQVHLDFHTSGLIDGIGSKFDKKQFQRCLKKGHVNSITVFAKCHHGYAYFPSKENQINPGLHGFDLLSAELEACKEIGVAAPVYISAGFDEKYAVEHPENLHLWHKGDPVPTVLEKDGVKYIAGDAMYHLVCMNTPYLEVLKKQTEEVTRTFMPVGLFFDIVAPRVCYCAHCTKSVIDAGLDPDDPESYRIIGERVYKHYVETVNNAARAIKPDIRLFHNAGHIPAGRRDLADCDTHLEIESLPTGGWGYDHFPRTARYAANLGKEYLGMTGKFHLSWGEFGGFKHPNALRYEVALSLALGAKCSVGDQMHPYGFLDDATYELIGAGYSYAEQVEKYCMDTTPVCDIALLSAESLSHGRRSNCKEDIGACRILLEGKYLYNVIDTDCDFAPYKLLILPDTVTVGDALAAKLKAYVAHGGKVLATGASATDKEGHFVLDFGVSFEGKSEYVPSYYRPTYNAVGLSPTSYVFYNQQYETKLTDETAAVLGYSRHPMFNRAPEHFCSHRHTPFVDEDNAPGVVIGKDGGYIAWNIFTEYAEIGSIILKDTVVRAIDAILGEGKTVTTNLPSQGIVTLTRQDATNRDVLHLLYAIPTKRGSGTEIIEDLPELRGTTVALRLPHDVKSVTLVPQNESIPFEQKDGVCRFTVDSFVCSQMVVIE